MKNEKQATNDAAPELAAKQSENLVLSRVQEVNDDNPTKSGSKDAQKNNKERTVSKEVNSKNIKKMRKESNRSTSNSKESKGSLKHSHSKRKEKNSDEVQLLLKKIQGIQHQITKLKTEHRKNPPMSAPATGELHSVVLDTARMTKEGPVHSKPAEMEGTSKNKRADPKLKQKESVRPEPAVSHLSGEELPPEHKLLLQLFMLNSSQRKKYIEKQGIQLGLLRPHVSKRNVVLVNEQMLQVSEQLVTEARRFLDDMKNVAQEERKLKKKSNENSTTKKSDQNDKVTVIKSNRRDNKGTYEEQVTFILNDGSRTATDDYDPRLILVGIRDKAKEIIQERLDEFVSSLVDRNFGYVVEGKLRINASNYMQAFVDDPSRKGNIYINSIILRRSAMEGDQVRVFVLNDSKAAESADSCENDNKSAEDVAEPKQERSQNVPGFVVAIVEKRHSRQCVGKFLPVTVDKKHYRMFMPRDTRIPAMRIFKQDWPNALLEAEPDTIAAADGGAGDGVKPDETSAPDVTDVVYQAEIIEWQDDIPIGTILKSLGKCGVLEVENKSILVEHNLDITPYDDEVLSQLPSFPYTIPKEELSIREDLRGECIFTIDPATARDLDDALSCKRLENGNYQVGVHISDVTYFLREGSALDELVKLRATSIYMVDSVYHMLPKQLCNTCSLLPGEDKLAFSVFWEMQPDGTILSTRFARTVINSCSQLSYEHAQIMLDHTTGDLEQEKFPEILHGYTPKALCEIIQTLQSIAVQLRQRRLDDGCLKINQPKLTFRLDPDSGRPLEYSVYKLRTSNEMIEDFMLLANTSVAHAVHSKLPDISLLRCHHPPAENMMKKLVQTLSNHGYRLSYGSPKDIRESMETIVDKAEHPDATQGVLNVLLAKPMTRAQYYCSAYATLPEHFMHYALAIPMYTHFTSPIRRYADCLVHRVLAASLGIDEVPKRSSEEVQILAMICNDKKYNAKLAGDASSLLYFRHWLATVGEYQTEAAVMGYAEHSIELVLIRSGIVLKTSLKKLPGVSKIVSDQTVSGKGCQLIPKDRSIPPLHLTIFTKVLVTIKVDRDTISVSAILPLPQQSAALENAEASIENAEVTELSEQLKSARVY